MASSTFMATLLAAERVEVNFQDISIPISIKELIEWNENEGQRSTELSEWLKLLGFEDREGLRRFLQTPLVRDKSMARQILRSWAGRKLLDEVSDLIRLDDDRSGKKVFNTFESLLQEQKEVNTLDLLNALPAQVVHLDLDAWVRVANRWRNELKKQQKLVADLSSLPSKLNESTDSEEWGDISTELKESSYEIISLNVPHREDPLLIEVWDPSYPQNFRSGWVVFMPGLGGDKKHFRWLIRSLSHHGWPVIVLDHPGSDSEAVQALVEGDSSLPGAEVIPDRIKDLEAVVQAREEGLIDIGGKNLVLMGHSLGALTAFMASGAVPVNGLEERCENVLEGLALSNLSALLQCQFIDIDLDLNQILQDKVKLIIAINSFGSLLWAPKAQAQISAPVLLTGGTFDLITPALSEQLNLFLSLKPHPFSRTLIVEGASHFSAIRVEGQSDKTSGEDLFQLGESLVGYHPLSVQSLLAEVIIKYIEGFEQDKALPIAFNKKRSKLKFHILDEKTINKLIMFNNVL